MYKLSSKSKKIIKQSVIYASMTLAVITLVTFIVFFVMGYRFNADDGSIEQYAFLQFGSTPSGAVVSIDGQIIGSKTPNKASVHAGKHYVTMQRDGYETWSKTIEVKPGTLTWLNYALLVPTNLKSEPIATYESLYKSLSSPDGRTILVQNVIDKPSFELVDISSDTVRSTRIVIDGSTYSQANATGVKHIFEVVEWDEGGRYVIVKHYFDDNIEWLVMDTRYVNLTKNITTLFNIAISKMDFFGTSGSLLYILEGKNIRKLDVAAGTISRPVVGLVTDFSLFDSSVLTYVGADATDLATRVIGLYRDGDPEPYILRTVSDKDSLLHVSTSKYFNDNYIAIYESGRVDIMSGRYPTNLSADSTMKTLTTLSLPHDVEILAFSPSGQYLMARSGLNFSSYDLEYQQLTTSLLSGDDTNVSLEWLDDNYLWSDSGNELSIMEFDGSNKHVIGKIYKGQDVVLTKNEKYIYYANKTIAGYQLQRLRMILP